MQTKNLLKMNFFGLLSLNLIFQVPATGFSATSLTLTNSAGPLVPCEKDMSFHAWLEGLKQEALALGITKATLNSVLPYLKLDSTVIQRDRSQGVFQQPFLHFSDRMVSAHRVTNGTSLIKTTHKEIFARIEKEFGVPAEPIVAFWALESDFGAFTGKFPILSSITTLAYDCRRPDMFRPQLIDAMKIIQRGDLKPDEMIGN